MRYCFNCGQQIDENAAFCPHCGTKQAQTGDYEQIPAITLPSNDSSAPTDNSSLNRQEKKTGCWKRAVRMLAWISALLIACSLISQLANDKDDDAKNNKEPNFVQTTTMPTAPVYAWVTGIDKCIGSGAYGELILPNHINVWNGWGDNRGRVVGEVSHAQKVEILDQRRDSNMTDNRLYYKIRTEDGLIGWLGFSFIQFRHPSQGFDPIEDC